MSIEIKLKCTFLIIFISLFGCDLRYGFLESNLQLSNESRLPIWFDIPQGYSRNDISMTILFYSHPLLGWPVKMTVYGPSPERKKLMETIGSFRWHPLTEREEQKDPMKYPKYSIISVNELEEVFEQKQSGAILHITDDPQLKSELEKKSPN